MNKKETKKVIEVMQAYVDGAEIETKVRLTDDTWHHCDPVWHWGAYIYRIKPKPREFWITDPGQSSDVLVALVTNENDKDQRNWIKVREV